MENFAKYTYLNNYIKKFRQKLPLENLTVQDLHQALYNVNIKPSYGTMYERKDIEYALNFEPMLNRIRKYLGLSKNSNQFNQFRQLSRQNVQIDDKKPNYYSNLDMEKESDKLLKQDDVFYENKIKLTENDLRKIVEECVKKIKSYYL